VDKENAIKIYSSTAWSEVVLNCVNFNSTLHFIGLLDRQGL